MNKYDIFISYKRKSLPTANNLYYRLTTRGYSTFFDLEEMRRDNFDVQLLNYIENAKDVFVMLEEGSLDGCKQENWEEKDWFCHEIAFALEKKKNIIPILLNGYQMPSQDFFPDRLKELSLKHSPEFNFSFFEAYLDKLIEKDYLFSKPNIQDKATSFFKFYSNENCLVYKEGKLVCILEGMSDEPFYLPVPRKGDYRFKAENLITQANKTIKEHVEANEEKEIEIEWEYHHPLKPDQEWPENIYITGDNYLVDLGYAKFNMIRVEGGEMIIGATQEQETDAETNEYPAHKVNLKTFYIGQFPITQNIWEIVMGYNKSHFRDKERNLLQMLMDNRLLPKVDQAGAAIGTMEGPIGGVSSAIGSPPLSAIAQTISKVIGTQRLNEKIKNFCFPDSCEIGHYPIENVSYDDALEFIRRLSKMTNIAFSLPTEDEWEYAARGGQKSQKYKYAGSDDLNKVAWYRDNADRMTHPVGEKAPNELGLYDMSGNVWEWTETPAHSYTSNIEPGGTIFIRRGGSWWHDAKNCRISRRYASDHTKRTRGLGLRVVIRDNVSKFRVKISDFPSLSTIPSPEASNFWAILSVLAPGPYFLLPDGKESKEYGMISPTFFIAGRNAQNKIDGTDVLKLNSDKVYNPHLKICRRNGSFYVIAFGPVTVNEYIMQKSEERKVNFGEQILINDEIAIEFKDA